MPPARWQLLAWLRVKGAASSCALGAEAAYQLRVRVIPDQPAWHFSLQAKRVYCCIPRNKCFTWLAAVNSLRRSAVLAVASTCKLTALHLGGCHITDAAIVAVVSGCKQLTTLGLWLLRQHHRRGGARPRPHYCSVLVGLSDPVCDPGPAVELCRVCGPGPRVSELG